MTRLRRRDYIAGCAFVLLFVHLLVNSGFDYFGNQKWHNVALSSLKVDCNQYGKIRDLEEKISELEKRLEIYASQK